MSISLKIKSFFGHQDLTKNSPLKAMLLFAIPLVMTTLLVNGMNLVNSLVLKYTVGGDSVTAINQTNSLSSMILQFGYGCTSGFGVLVANYYGAKDEEKIKKTIISSIIFCFFIWITLSTLGIIFLKPLLHSLNVHELYFDKAYRYFLIVLIGYFILLLSNLSAHILRALGDSFFVFVCSFITIGLQIGLCFLLTTKNIGNLDTIGAAIAMLAASLVNVIICFAFIFKRYPLTKESFKFDKEVYFGLAKLGIPLGFQWSILFIGNFVLNSQVNTFGPNASKGMTVYSSTENLVINSLMGSLGLTIVNFVGQNYGAKLYERMKKGIKEGYLFAFIIYLIILAIILPLAKVMAYVYLPKEEVNERIIFYSSVYLYIVASTCLLQGIIQVSRGSLLGTKRPLFAFLSGVGELIARISIAFLIPYLVDNDYKNTHSDPSYIGLSFSNTSAWVMAASIMTIAVLIFIFRKKEGNSSENE